MERELVRYRLECGRQGSWSSPKWYPLRGAGQARQEHRNCPISHNFKLSNVEFQSTTWGRWEPRADRRQGMANRPRGGRGRPGEHIDHQGVGSNQEGKSTKGGGPINARGRPFDHSGGGGGTEDPPSQDHYLGRWVDQFQNMYIRNRTCFWNGLASLWLRRGPTFLLGFGDRAEHISENLISRI